jgi:prephenate dehydrogenase
MTFSRVAIIGVGMIGASLARALKKHSLADELVGCGRGKKNLELALERGYVDSLSHDPAEAAGGADIVVLATPVETLEEIAANIAGSLMTGALVMDVGSIKGELVSRIQALMPEGVEFVGCHPIAGSEQAGAAASVEDLFSGAKCIITRTGSNTDANVSRAREFWEAIGSVVRVMDPLEHDKLLGLVSHFPHLVAYAMINAIEDRAEGAIALSGAGLKDTTRIAMSPAFLWRDISLMNRGNVLPVLDTFIDEIGKIRKCLEEGDSAGLESLLRKAELRRRSIED